MSGGTASAIQRQFARPAGLLGRLAGWTMTHRPSNRLRSRWTVSLLGIEGSDRVLEIGFGPGLPLAEAARHVDGGGCVVGIDHSPLMLRMAEARNAAALRAGRLDLRCGGLALLDELGAPFDKVFSVNVAMFWPDREIAWQMIAGVLVPGGLLATTYQPRHRRASAADAYAFAETLSGELAGCGFRDIRTETLPLRPVPAICVLARRAH